MKIFAVLALALAAIVAAKVSPDETIPFAQEPEVYESDATVAFVDEPGYSDAESTRSLDFNNLENNEFADSEEHQRQLLVAETMLAFQIGAMAAPIVTEIIKGKRKECQQVACWIASDSRSCAVYGAERVQQEVTMGRDRYRYESIQDNGMWVRYWRTKFEPVDRGDVASGNCTDGALFTVTNCQSTGRVHC